MACSLVVEEVSSVMIVSSLLAAKHDCVSQSRGPQWFPLSVGRHGRTAVHAAIGEGGTDGWHRHPQGPPRGAPGRGRSRTCSAVSSWGPSDPRCAIPQCDRELSCLATPGHSCCGR